MQLKPTTVTSNCATAANPHQWTSNQMEGNSSRSGPNILQASPRPSTRPSPEADAMHHHSPQKPCHSYTPCSLQIQLTTGTDNELLHQTAAPIMMTAMTTSPTPAHAADTATLPTPTEAISAPFPHQQQQPEQLRQSRGQIHSTLASHLGRRTHQV